MWNGFQSPPRLSNPIHLPLGTMIYQNPSREGAHYRKHYPIWSYQCRVQGDSYLRQSGWCRVINPDKNDFSFLSSCLMLWACLDQDMNALRLKLVFVSKGATISHRRNLNPTFEITFLNRWCLKGTVCWISPCWFRLMGWLFSSCKYQVVFGVLF